MVVFEAQIFHALQILALGLIAFILMLVWDAPWNWVREVILLGLIAAGRTNSKWCCLIPLCGKAGQNGCQNRVTARTSDFFNCVECTNAQYSIYHYCNKFVSINRI